MITEDYVSFETAKLLKEKGFYEECYLHYSSNGKTQHWNYQSPIDGISAPTFQMTMKWLREVHNILIIPDYNYECTDKSYCYKIYKLGKNGKPERVPVEAIRYDTLGKPHAVIIAYRDYKMSYSDYKTYEEACEAAIKYCLKNLIKNEDEEKQSDIPVPKTIDEAISTLEKILSDEDREYLLKNGAISMHNSLGRWIRNEWGLWTGSELKDELMNMNKGLNHPDDMSNYIIEEFIKYWNNKL